MSSMSPAASPGWMRPDDVMKMRKMKAKKRALSARMNTSLPLQISLTKSSQKNTNVISHGIKRKNPFRLVKINQYLFNYFSTIGSLT